MIDINKHPIWKGNQIWGGINPLKKRAHMMRFFLARQYAKRLKSEMFIGITGSVGKTTTTAACFAVLSEKFKTLVTEPNLDPILNIPITILKVRKKTKKVILEMGIEYPGEMDFYLSMIKPAVGIITKIAYQHSEFLGGVEEILREKGRLIEQLPASGFAILNWDDQYARKLAEKTKAEVVYYGFDESNCHISASKVKITDFQTQFELNYGVERVQVNSQLLGVHQVYPLLAAAALGVTQGINLVAIKRGLEKVEAPDHRMQILPGFNNALIIDDTHNAAPTAVEEAIETLNQLPARRRIVVLGEMRELGEFSERMHRQVAAKLYKEKVDLVFLGGGEAKIIGEELISLGFIPERMQMGLSNPQIVAQLLQILAKGDVVLLKGARSTRLDEVVSRLVKK